jgi:hypothetical protein
MIAGAVGDETTVMGESSISIEKALRGLRDCNKTDSDYLVYLGCYRNMSGLILIN